MDRKLIKIDGRIFDLNDPEQKKAAVAAWLAFKSSSGPAGDALFDYSGIEKILEEREGGISPSLGP